MAIVAGASPPARIAVVPALTVNLEPAEARSIADEFARALSARLSVVAVSGDLAEGRLPTGRLPDGCAASPACTAEVARYIGVDGLLLLVVVRLGGATQIEATWAAPGGARSEVRDKLVFGPGDALAELVAARAETLLPGVPVRGPGEVAPDPGPVPAPRLDLAGHAPDATRPDFRPTWIAAGVAVASVGTGVALGLVASSHARELERDGCDRAGSGCAPERVDTLAREALLADVFYGVGAVATVAAVWLALDAPRLRVAAGPVDGGAAVSLGGAF